VFTTFRNPLHPNRKLAPLYRLSRLKPTAYNRLHVDHVYVADQAAVAGYTRVGYKLDGIEGYIYPYNEPRPAGTVRLYTKYNVTRDDNALFPESMAAEMARQGYTRNSRKAWIGYVYPNIDTDGDGLIDGFERIIRTNRYNPDSDRDGVSDGREVNDLLTDPLRS
jgi:hypothetical protein